MARQKLAGRTAVVVGVFALLACSDRSPVSPNRDVSRPADARAVAVTGSYELSFYTHGLVPVTSLTVFQELILGAHVATASGIPAQRGSVTFQYCSLRGLPSNDINRPDEAPSAACATGDAAWSQLITVPVDASGNAYMNFGFVSIPRTVGFRFRYTGQGSGIPNGVSAPQDFTWVSAG